MHPHKMYNKNYRFLLRIVNSLAQPVKALLPIFVTLSGMVMEVRDLQPQKAY